MTARVAEDGLILLEGVCTVEDAGMLLQLLSDGPERKVDWSGCEQAHTAVIQVLVAVRPRLIGWPRDPFVGNYLAALFDRL